MNSMDIKSLQRNIMTDGNRNAKKQKATISPGTLENSPQMTPVSCSGSQCDTLIRPIAAIPHHSFKNPQANIGPPNVVANGRARRTLFLRIHRLSMGLPTSPNLVHTQ